MVVSFAFALKNGVQFDISKMAVSLDRSTPIYKGSLGSEQISGNTKKGEYTCSWAQYPSLITSSCNTSKSICAGKVHCTDSKGVSIDAEANCSSSTAGTQCADASACANADDAKEIADVNKCLGVSMKVSGQADGPVPKSGVK